MLLLRVIEVAIRLGDELVDLFALELVLQLPGLNFLFQMHDLLLQVANFARAGGVELV